MATQPIVYTADRHTTHPEEIQVHQTNKTGPPLPTQFAFVVQFAAETAVGQGRFVGRVEHVVSGQVAHFSSLEDLLAFLSRVLAEQGASSAEPAS